MFELILALFGIGHYGIKLADEKARKRDADVRRAVYDSIEEKVRCPIGDISYRAPETREEFWIMCESIIDDLRYIFGDNWRTKLNFTLMHYYRRTCEQSDVVRNTFLHPVQIAYHVWLSKKGKYYWLYSQGYNRRVYNGVNSVENQELIARVCKTIEKNIQAAHPDLPIRLVVVPDKPWLVRWWHFYDSRPGLERPW